MKLIRVDFDSNIGFGHLKRVENLIKEGIIVCIKCDEKYTNLPVIKIKNEDEFFEVVKKLNPSEVIVDNYNFTYEDEKKLKTLFPKIKLICFDDTYEKHFCDEIININPAAKREKYPKNIKAQILKKPLVSEDFKKAKKRHFNKRGIFVSFGGTDSKGIGLKVLKELKKLKKEVHFFTTSANKNLKNLKKFCFLNRWCHLHINENVALGMAKSKFGIITPSTIALEAIYMNMPFITIEVANNQKEISKHLKQKRIKVLKENEIQKIPRLVP